MGQEATDRTDPACIRAYRGARFASTPKDSCRAWMRQIYRILSFFVLGLLMLGAAYLYHKAERLLTETPGGQVDESASN